MQHQRPSPWPGLRCASWASGPWLVHLGLVVWLALLGPIASAQAAEPAAQKPWPAVLQAWLAPSLDDPQSALAQVRQRQRQGGRGEEAFWLNLAAARLQLLLEDDASAAASLGAARRELEALSQAPAELGLWLEFLSLRHRAFTEGNPAALQALVAARSRLRIDPVSVLGCEWDETESWLLREMGSLDEAWRATEALERCGSATGWPHFRAQALSDRAYLAGFAASQGLAGAALPGIGGVGALDPERVARLFEEAYAAAGPGAARFLRSLIAFSAGATLDKLGQAAAAQRQLQRALDISRALGDRAGIAAALTRIAALDVQLGRHAEALDLLAEAEPVLRQIDSGTASRLVMLYETRLQSLLALDRRAELPAALTAAMALPDQGVQPLAQSRLARAIAAAYAAQGRHAQAYEWMERAHRLAEQSRSLASTAQVLRLQTLYDASRREAELAQLRHDQETARLSLQAQQATARMLWAALVAAAALAAGVAVLGWRQWARRREMARLALRDTLTGLSNRRSIEAYARVQLEQSQRLKLPFTLALIDLDHFKSVNDQHGHATGDALLRAFAQAAPAALRAPDRLGRWGGEEFLLVLPGTARAELPALFERLRGALAAVPVPGLPEPHGRTFSMGGAEAGSDGGSVEALLHEADRRLYEAKAAGRDRLA